MPDAIWIMAAFRSDVGAVIAAPPSFVKLFPANANRIGSSFHSRLLLQVPGIPMMLFLSSCRRGCFSGLSAGFRPITLPEEITFLRLAMAHALCRYCVAPVRATASLAPAWVLRGSDLPLFQSQVFFTTFILRLFAPTPNLIALPRVSAPPAFKDVSVKSKKRRDMKKKKEGNHFFNSLAID